jgi:Flp pilus assembly protein TadG
MRRDEAGQITLLIVGFAVVLLMAIAAVIDVTAAYLQRQALITVADGAALAGADAGSANEQSLYGQGIGDAERLEQQRTAARTAVADFLRSTGAYGEHPGLTFGVRVDATQNSVVVTVRAPLDLPLTVPGSRGRTSISASGSATVVLDD